ncbi:hypothetical protein SAMN06264364_11171 [Quadrisphaera granulorum]|uniref:Uncharacterized protein n=1 Tax=Quadrisphaera granulorum TaxID=317664 RepID=A0A316A8Y1_9ACTN|nr:hypothetical protein BXY45_11171 [Quadrisphaera granulorum]SZE96712.1 hypothetical protein SAMN06264364_11171 [Quadrisphaera granulorum]
MTAAARSTLSTPLIRPIPSIRTHRVLHLTALSRVVGYGGTRLNAGPVRATAVTLEEVTTWR